MNEENQNELGGCLSDDSIRAISEMCEYDWDPTEDSEDIEEVLKSCILQIKF